MNLKKSVIGFLTVTTAMVQPSLAVAQSAEDVIIMRRVLAPPKRSTAPIVEPTDPNEIGPVPGSDLNSYYWVVSGWLSLPDDTCSSQAVQTRFRGCVLKGVSEDPALCPQPAPPEERIVAEYKGCKYSWEATPSGPWADQCSSETSRPLSAICKRENGDTVPDSFCTTERPTVENGANFEGCTYRWVVGEYGNWDKSCSDEAVRERPVICLRSDNAEAAPALCPKPVPNSEEVGENYSGCTFSWSPGPWSAPDSTCSTEAVITRVNNCIRSDGEPASREQCDQSAEPPTQDTVEDLSGCGYEWAVGEYGEWSSTCSSSATRTRTVSCRRTDGKTVADSFCPGEKPDLQETGNISTSCTYEWEAGSWEQSSRCSANAIRTRSLVCRRSDGFTALESDCAGLDRPVTSEEISDFSGCRYQWEASAWSPWADSCSDLTTRTRTAKCVREDDVEVASSFCNQDNIPALSEEGENYAGCERIWTTGEWTNYNSTCSQNATRTRSVRCVEIRPTETESVDEGACNAADRPVDSESTSIFTGCENVWKIGPWGWNGVANAYSSTCSANAQQTRTVTCEATLPGGVKVTAPDANCPGDKPETVQTSQQFNGCTYSWIIGEWGPFNSTCSNNATRTRTVQCTREDGTNPVLPDADCNNAGIGPTPIRTETRANVTDCTGIVRNSSFEEGTANWNMTAGSSISTTVSFTGTSSLMFSTVFFPSPVTQSVQTVPGARYGISYRVRTNETTRGVRLHINGAWWQVTTVNNVSDVVNRTWVLGTSSFTATGTTTLIGFGRSDSNGSQTFVDDVILTRLN